MSEEKPKINVERGKFPFPIIDGPLESRYLTWVRNHSNYMAERGVLDYLRMVAVLVRGILINFLTLLPYLLIASVVLGLTYNKMLDDWHGSENHGAGHPNIHTTIPAELGAVHKVGDSPHYSIEWFATKKIQDGAGWAGVLQSKIYGENATTPYLISPMILGLGVMWVFFFPIYARLSKIARYRKSLETGSSSSVKKRDILERTFGGFLCALLAITMIETFPTVVYLFHQILDGETVWTLPTVTGAVVALIAANKILPLLKGVVKKIAILLVGAIGLIIPFLVVLFVTEFLVFEEDPYNGILNFLLLILPLLIGVAFIFAMILGIGKFKGRSYFKLTGLLLGMIVLFILALAQVVSADFIDGWGNYFFVALWAVEIWIFCSLIVDVNLTSINGLYRDRLASAFLVGVDTKGDVDIEQDIDLQEICNYEAGSTAPYHIVNVALNLQGSKDIAIRERNSDFFIFSKRFVGSERTAYCTSENMEQVYPQIDLGTAMAISAAAASPNMGRNTNPLMVAFMTLLNVRLGFWVPNPGLLERDLAGKGEQPSKPGYSFNEVFKTELDEIELRRRQAGQLAERPLAKIEEPSTAHNLVGIGFSGGGIRSATVNMGIAQALHKAGVFDHIDYMSTVSGGGYLGSSISTLMRYKTSPFSEIDGTVSLEENGKLVRVTSKDDKEKRDYLYAEGADLDEKIKEGAEVKAGDRLLKRRATTGKESNSLMDRFNWRVRPSALLCEMISKINETSKWVNLSDGGHIENLATIELLRRRCRFIIIGDGEADPNLHFNGLATLIRFARIDLGIHINVDPAKLRLRENKESGDHFVFGTIKYPKQSEPGYLLYLKSSFTGDEDEVIQEYRHRNPAFPHESTADQFFDEGQFEAYRALGQHIGEKVLKLEPEPESPGKLSFSEFETWFKKGVKRDVKKDQKGCKTVES